MVSVLKPELDTVARLLVIILFELGYLFFIAASYPLREFACFYFFPKAFSVFQLIWQKMIIFEMIIDNNPISIHNTLLYCISEKEN